MTQIRTIAICIAASTFLALAPAGAADDTPAPYMTPPLCSTTTATCTQATVTYQVVPTADGQPCLYVHGTGRDTTYDCTVEWTLRVDTQGTSCGWAYMAPTGEVLNCVLLPVGIAFPRQATGPQTYRVTVGTHTVHERLWVCVDYSTPFEDCGGSPYDVPATLPALDPRVNFADPPTLEAILESIVDVSTDLLTWATGQPIPPE